MTDKDAFCEHIRLCENAMYSLAFSIVRNGSDAGEIISESIYRAYKNLDTLKNENSFKPWILRIVHNTAVEMIRKNSRIIPMEETPDIPDDSPENDITTSLTVREAVNSLKQPYRTVVVLFYYENLSVSKIAQITNTNVAQEQTEIPDSVKNRIEQTLADLPEKKPVIKQIRILPRIAAAAACFIFITLFLLPNVSVAYAQALEQIPVIGDIVQVVTIRNYFYADDKHEMGIDVPQIEGEDSEAVDYINKDVSELTTALVNQFYKDLEITGNNGYGSIHVDYEVTTNTDRWFTLKLSVSETAASSNTYFEFYHIDKKQGKIVELGDLFNTDKFSDILVAEIKMQMQEQMANDENISYWINNSGIGEEFATVSADHNFYWNENGDLVIIFDEYEVGPGSMGTPEFVIDRDVIKDILKSEFKDIIL